MQFPYKRVVTCPHCGKQLHGSSSRGKLGKYYPAYHCRRDGHNFRVPLQEFEDTISAYVRSLQVNTAYLEDFTDAIRNEWERRSKATMSETDVIDEQIKNLAYEARQSMDKIKFLNSETAIKYIEEELVRIEGLIEQLKYQKTTLKVKQPVEIEDLIRYTKYFFEHLDILLLKQSNPIAKANFFSLIFNTPPTFSALEVRTPENKKTTEVSDVFLALLTPDDHVAGDEGFEPPITGPEPVALPLGQSPVQIKIIPPEL